MAILTKFLQLLKPERNDYVDVEKHLSENYDKIDTKMEELSNSNDKKLDKGTVSTEYDTAKKIEDKVKKIIDEKWKIVTKSLNNGDDLNNYNIPGFYTNELSANNIINAPFSNRAFLLKVESIQPNSIDQYATQTLMPYDTSNIYIRHNVDTRWGAWEKLARISEVDEKFKNFCPFPVNSLYLSLGNENPNTLWLGTTWQKQENRFLLGAGSTYGLGSTGGNANISLGINNIPRHRHKVDSTSASVPAHVHSIKPPDSNSDNGYGKCATGGQGTEGTGIATFNSGSAGGGSTGTFSPYTDYQGNGQSFSIMPPYLAVNIWKRTS